MRCIRLSSLTLPVLVAAGCGGSPVLLGGESDETVADGSSDATDATGTSDTTDSTSSTSSTSSTGPTEDESSSESDSEAGEDDSSSTGTPKFDTLLEDDDSTTGPDDEVDWLLNADGGTLNRVDRYDATVTVLCDLVDPEDPMTSIEFSSMTFARDDRLFGSHDGALYEIALPSCDVTKVGAFGGAVTSVNGISPDEGYGLFAIDTNSNALYRIDADTAVATLIGPAGYDIGFGGATWVEADQRLLAVDSSNDSLNEVDTMTGTYTYLADLQTPLNLVGFEHHPHGGQLYACSSGNAEGLWEIAADGGMNYVGSMGFGCNDLAAPWETPVLPQG